jgi:Nuclease-related domain
MDKMLKIKRPGICVSCAVAMPVGTQAYWNSDRRTLRCVTCREPTASLAAPGTPNLEQDADVARNPDTGPGAWSLTKPDVAGHSAQKEFEKRAAKELLKKQEVVNKDAAWRIEIRERRPLIGRLVAAASPKPQIGPMSQSTTAWDKGATGERRVAEILGALHDVEVLHDRLMPKKGAANIDHIAVAASGIFVIDAKMYNGTLEVLNKGTVFRTVERLYVAGRDRTKLTNGVLSQVEAVRTVLGKEWGAIPVYGVLCFIGCEWTKQKPKFLNGVTVTWPKGLPAHVMKPGPHLAQADAIASLLRRTLKQPN